MKRYYIIFISLFLVFQQSQAQISIKGRVSDAAENISIGGADIVLKGTHRGTTSAKDGSFELQCNRFPCRISVSHLGYRTQEIVLRHPVNEGLYIELERDTSQLKAFNVFAEKVICINPRDKYFITDFRLMDRKIIALAYKNRMKGNRYLIVYDDFGNKITETEISGDNGFYQDPLMNCYIRMQNKGWQVLWDSAGILFSEPFPEKILDSAEKSLAGIKEDTILLRNYFMSNQGIAFYYLPDENGDVSLFRAYLNEDAAGMLSWGPIFDGNEFDRRFAEQIFFKPVKIHVFVLDEEIIMFNTVSGTIEHISGFAGSTVSTAEMSFVNEPGWTRDILFDNVTGKFYTVFISKGIYRISGIDIYTGDTAGETIIEGYTHIERVSIMNGMLYFLYKRYYTDDYKRLYMSLLH